MSGNIGCGVLAGVLSACWSHAQTNAPARAVAENARPETSVEVVASPITQFEQTARDGASSAVVSRGQLERLSAVDLPTALRQVPGVTISRYNAVGGYGSAQGGSVYIRGAGTARPGSEIKIYTAGVPRESGVWSHPIMDIAPIDFAEALIVTKNPQPQNFPGTFGAVDITMPRRLTDGHEVELGAAYGRFNTLISSASVGGKMDLFDYYAGTAYKYSEGKRRHSDANLFNAFGQAGWSLSEHERLSYLYQLTDNWVRDPGRKGAPTPKNDRFASQTDTHSIRLDTDREFIKGYALIYFEDGEMRWHKDHLSDGNLMSPPGYSNTDWQNYGFRSVYDILIKRLTLTAGLDTWSDGGETWNINEVINQRVWGYNGRFFYTAPYLGARYDFGLGSDWELTPSLGSRYYFSSEHDDEWGPCAALTLSRHNLSFFLSHARGVHYPGIYMRGVSPATWRSLDAEVMDTYELGSHLDVGEIAALHAVLFHTEIDNRMDETSTGFLNTGEMKSNGAELSAHLFPTRDLSLFAGFTYTDPLDRPASRMPTITSSAGASYRFLQYVRWDVDAEFVSSQYAYGMRESNPQLEKLDDHLVFNTRLGLDTRAFCKLDGELYVAIENFTNQRHEYFPGYPMPGAMWYTGMKVRF